MEWHDTLNKIKYQNCNCLSTYLVEFSYIKVLLIIITISHIFEYCIIIFCGQQCTVYV